MRIGVTLPADREVELAVAAEAVGLPFVYVAATPGTESVDRRDGGRGNEHCPRDRRPPSSATSTR